AARPRGARHRSDRAAGVRAERDPRRADRDTGGSIRIPAALQGIVGFKSTARLVPTAGAVPLSTTLDTVCAITRSVRDAIAVHEVLAARTVGLERRPLDAWRFAVPQTLVLDDLDATVARAFE